VHATALRRNLLAGRGVTPAKYLPGVNIFLSHSTVAKMSQFGTTAHLPITAVIVSQIKSFAEYVKIAIRVAPASSPLAGSEFLQLNDTN
jgi:hypothetical protein